MSNKLLDVICLRGPDAHRLELKFCTDCFMVELGIHFSKRETVKALRRLADSIAKSAIKDAANSTDAMEGKARKCMEEILAPEPNKMEDLSMEQMVAEAKSGETGKYVAGASLGHPISCMCQLCSPNWGLDKDQVPTTEEEEIVTGPIRYVPDLLETQKTIRTAKLLAVERILKLLDISDEENEIAISIVRAYGFGLEDK